MLGFPRFSLFRPEMELKALVSWGERAGMCLRRMALLMEEVIFGSSVTLVRVNNPPWSTEPPRVIEDGSSRELKPVGGTKWTWCNSINDAYHTA